MIQLLTTFYFAAGQPTTCSPRSSFLNFPTWYQYLNGVTDASGNCIPRIQALSDFWLIVAAIVEILLRVATIAAIAMVLYGGVTYILSQGEPDKTSKAKDTVLNALIGLVIAVTASVIVSFVARQF